MSGGPYRSTRKHKGLGVLRSRSEAGALARSVFSGIPTNYEFLAEALSFGQNRRWQRALVDAVAAMSPAPSLLLDVATGTGAVARQVALRTPATIVGIDISRPMLDEALRRAPSGCSVVKLVEGSAERLPFADGTFDALTFTYLLRYVSDPVQTMRELARVVKPGGFIGSLEFGVPASPVLHGCWLAYTRTFLPLAGAVMGGRAWWNVARFLGPSISEHRKHFSLVQTIEAWRLAGLTDVTPRTMSLGGGVVMWGRKRGE